MICWKTEASEWNTTLNTNQIYIKILFLCNTNHSNLNYLTIISIFFQSLSPTSLPHLPFSKLVACFTHFQQLFSLKAWIDFSSFNLNFFLLLITCICKHQKSSFIRFLFYKTEQTTFFHTFKLYVSFITHKTLNINNKTEIITEQLAISERI